jgi:hypothetical protein
MSTMNSLKTLMLAGAAVLSIGVGGAMAAGPNYWSAQQQAPAGQTAANQGRTVTTTRNSTVQYGTSDFAPFEQPARPDPSLGVAGGF